MPSWTDLLAELEAKSDDQKPLWLKSEIESRLESIGQRRGNRHVMIYASAFLQKPGVSPWTLQLTAEEINGFMSSMYGMNWSKNLTLILHTPGGITNAAETIVAYLHSKFDDIEVIVPTFAMSAGTMIALAANRIVMGRQSQLGPIDPQIPLPEAGRPVSARAIVDQFERAQNDIAGKEGDLNRAHVWAPILQRLGPALLQEAQNALSYGEDMVAGWLKQRMFAGDAEAEKQGAAVAKHFNDAGTHKSHGRRIDRNEARSHGVVIEDLEDDQDLQDDVLTVYHLVTLLFEKTATAKLIWTDTGRTWMKNLPVPSPPPT
jgi:hypothetical protein